MSDNIHESHTLRIKTGDYLVCIACMRCACHPENGLKEECNA